METTNAFNIEYELGVGEQEVCTKGFSEPVSQKPGGEADRERSKPLLNTPLLCW